MLDATTLYFYDNTGSATSPSFNATAPVATLALDGLLLSAHVIDMDGDGLLDVVVRDMVALLVTHCFVLTQCATHTCMHAYPG